MTTNMFDIDCEFEFEKIVMVLLNTVDVNNSTSHVQTSLPYF